MTESRDKMTGIYRHEYATVSPADASKAIRSLEGIKEFAEDKYRLMVKGQMVEIYQTPTRVIVFGLNRFAMLEVAKELKPSEWEYDNTTPRTDYMGKSV